MRKNHDFLRESVCIYSGLAVVSPVPASCTWVTYCTQPWFSLSRMASTSRTSFWTFLGRSASGKANQFERAFSRLDLVRLYLVRICSNCWYSRYAVAVETIAAVKGSQYCAPIAARNVQ